MKNEKIEFLKKLQYDSNLDVEINELELRLNKLKEEKEKNDLAINGIFNEALKEKNKNPQSRIVKGLIEDKHVRFGDVDADLVYSTLGVHFTDIEKQNENLSNIDYKPIEQVNSEYKELSQLLDAQMQNKAITDDQYINTLFSLKLLYQGYKMNSLRRNCKKVSLDEMESNNNIDLNEVNEKTSSRLL